MYQNNLPALFVPFFIFIAGVYSVNSVTNHHEQQLGRHKFQESNSANWPPPSPPLSSIHHSLEAQSHASSVLPANNNRHDAPAGHHQHQRSTWHVTGEAPTTKLATHQVASSSHAANAFLMPSHQLELALRQASGDESVFQPSPAIGPLMAGHTSNGNGNGLGFDWHQYTTTSKQRIDLLPTTAATTSITTAPTTQSPQTTTTAKATTAKTTTTTTELNNQLEPLVLNHQQSILSLQKEYQSVVVNGSLSEQFNNQVIYEGPATAPSSANSDDYYYSSSERTPASELLTNSNGNGNINGHDQLPTSNSWWALGIGEEFERINNLTRDNYLAYCDQSTLLVDGKQRSLCRMHPRVMAVVARGLKMAIDECQAKFATGRWNCSLVIHESVFTNNNNNNNQRPLIDENENLLQTSASSTGQQHGQSTSIFGDFMRRPNRERSFLNAIIAAGLAHSMTKACSQGELPEECSCDRKIKSKSNKGKIEWVACSDDIDYGARFSRDFTDNFDPTESDATSTIYMHNSEVGRRVFKSATDITCTCLATTSDQLSGTTIATHPTSSGSCQTKRCWKHLGSFSDIVDELIKRYEGATHVQRSNKDPHKLRPVRRGVRRPKRKDLVYIEQSPDYCQKDTRIGVLGTQNRVCNSTSQGPDSCSLLCCGRGFQTVVEHIEEDCNCKFVWCCQVKCDKCKRFVSNDVCN